MKLQEEFRVEVKEQAFFDWVNSLYDRDYNLYKDGNTLYVTQEVYDRLRGIAQ